MSKLFPYSDRLDPKLPLSGLKVVDLSRLLPGPHASLMLADLGADVLKVEDPQVGDYLRWGWPPGDNPAFLQLNRNKRSLTLNLKATEGRAIFKRVVAEADILIESFRPGVMARLGLGYDDLKAVNSGLIYCAISGYGQSGPLEGQAGHDLNYIGYAGALSQSGSPDAAPVIPGLQIADLAGGSLMALVAILAAVQGRHLTGQGRMLDVAMSASVASLLPLQASVFLATGQTTRRGQGQLNGAVPEYNVYETADGLYLTVGALEPKFFNRLCTLLGMAEFDEINANPERAALIKGMLVERFKQRTRAEWLEFFRGEEVCVGPAYELDEVYDDPQIAARGLIVEGTHPDGTPLRQLGLPFLLNDLSPQEAVRFPAPGFGEHTTAVLDALGFDPAAIEELRARGVVGH